MAPDEMEKPPMVAQVDEVGDSIEIMRGGVVIATVNNYYDFPCADEDIDLEAFHAEAVATGQKFAASDDMVDALEAIAIALAEPAGGEYWTARAFLDKHDIYNEDLSGTRVLLRVAELALTKAGGEKCHQCGGIRVNRGEFCDGCTQGNAEETPEQVY